MRKPDEKGFNLVQLSFAVLILGLFAQAFVLARLVSAKKTVDIVEHGFAAMKAGQIFNELQADASGGLGDDVLDAYDDGPQYELVMTTDKLVNQPGDPLSGNQRVNGHWLYLRQVQVKPAQGDPQARQVVVKIWTCQSDGNPPVPGLLLNTTIGTVAPGGAVTYAQTPVASWASTNHYEHY